MDNPVHLEIHSANIDKSKDFYSKVFNWSFDRWGGPKSYWLKNSSTDNDLKITILQKTLGQGVVNTFKVESVENTLNTVIKNGGKIVVNKTLVEGSGYIAYFSDLDGNIFGIVEKNSIAK